MDEPGEKDSLTPDSVEAINNLDTARMSLRWALERIRSLERRVEPLLAELNEYKLKTQQEQRSRLELKERLAGSEENAQWLAQTLERERARRRQSEQNSQRVEEEFDSVTDRCATLETQARELTQQNKRKQAELEELKASLERERAAAAQEFDDLRRKESQHQPRLLELERRLSSSEEDARRAAEALSHESEWRRRLEAGETALKKTCQAAVNRSRELEIELQELLRENQKTRAELDALKRAERYRPQVQEEPPRAVQELKAPPPQNPQEPSRFEEDIIGLQREKKRLQEDFERLLRESRENAGKAAQALAKETDRRRELEQRHGVLLERVVELERQIQEGRSGQIELEVLTNSLQREKATLSGELAAWKRKALEAGGGPEAEARFTALAEEMKRREATLLAQKKQAEEMGDFLAKEYERKRAEVERLKADFLKGMAKAMERYSQEDR